MTLTWVVPALVFGAAALAAVVWSYRAGSMGSTNPTARWIAAGFKLAGFVLLLLCLTEPLARRVRARPQSRLGFRPPNRAQLR